MPRYLYLHGFASSPNSAKAQVLRGHFQALGISLEIPDLNQGNFSQLTLSRQIRQVTQLIQQDEQPIVLIGSSLGGLTAAWVAEQPEVHARIQRLVLLAPAFQFLAQWLPRLSADQLQQWREIGNLSVYHYGSGRQIPLNYDFLRDAQQYEDDRLRYALPTLILHGRQDETISIRASQDYAADRPWVRLIELESDHALGNVQEVIWQAVQAFLDL
jgi:hypothetical protein